MKVVLRWRAPLGRTAEDTCCAHPERLTTTPSSFHDGAMVGGGAVQGSGSSWWWLLLLEGVALLVGTTSRTHAAASALHAWNRVSHMAMVLHLLLGTIR